MAFGQFSGNAGEQVTGFGYTNASNGPTTNSSNPYFPNDIDLETLPELLSCDVDEVSEIYSLAAPIPELLCLVQICNCNS